MSLNVALLKNLKYSPDKAKKFVVLMLHFSFCPSNNCEQQSCFSQNGNLQIKIK